MELLRCPAEADDSRAHRGEPRGSSCARKTVELLVVGITRRPRKERLAVHEQAGVPGVCPGSATISSRPSPATS